MPVEHPSDLVGKTSSMDPQDGRRSRTRIVRAIEDHDGETADNLTRLNSLLALLTTMSLKISSRSPRSSTALSDDSEETTLWKFKRHCA
jgi:hypothetical protein